MFGNHASTLCVEDEISKDKDVVLEASHSLEINLKD